MSDGNIAFFRAVQDESLEKVQEILNNGKTSVNVRDLQQDGQTALHMAATKGNIDMVKMLIEKYSANYDLEDEFGEVPVHKAADLGHLDIVTYLLTKQCKYAEDVLHLVNSKGDSAHQGDIEAEHKHLQLNDLLNPVIGGSRLEGTPFAEEIKNDDVTLATDVSKQ